jgi:DNA-binding NtrC family response regulator
VVDHAAVPTGGEIPDNSDLSLLEVGRRAAWEAERRAIQHMLEITHWNRREASRRLQVSYKALLNKIKQMQLEDTALKELGTEITQENRSTH